jgi:predicted transposase/invertase (TIGR01784 family)
MEDNSDSLLFLTHDRFFRKSMSSLKLAREFFETHLPEEVLGKVDLMSLKEEKGDFLSKHLEESRTDVLFSVNFGPEQGYIFLHVEHQTKSDYWIALRLVKYMVNMYDYHMHKNPKAKTLPLIFPMVYYAGKQEYTAPRQFWDLFSDPILAKSFFTEPYRLIELQKIDDLELRKKLNSGVMQYVMKRIFEQDILPFIKLIEPDLAKLALEKNSYVETILCYIMRRGESSNADEVIEIFKHIVSEEEKSNIMTIAEQFIERGVQQGIQLGKQEGIQYGMQLGKQEGINETSKHIATNMLAEGQSADLIARVTGLKLEDILKLQNQLH